MAGGRRLPVLQLTILLRVTYVACISLLCRGRVQTGDMRKTVALAAVIGALAGACGSNQGSSSSPPAATSTAVTPASVAQQLGCSNFQSEKPTEMFVKAAGTCTLNGQKMQVDVFEDKNGQEQWLKIAKQAAGLTNEKTGELWVAYPVP